MNCDVLIIGGGMAGAMAAIAAVEKGAETVLVSRAPGATAMHSGAFDIEADPFRPKFIAEPEENTLEKNLERIAIANPHHPYAVIPNSAETLRRALKLFISRLGDAGLELSGARDGYLLLGNNIGTLRRTRICLSTMTAGDFLEMSAARLLVLGVSGLENFHAQFAAASFKSLADKVKPGLVDFAAGEEIAFSNEPGASLANYRAAELFARSEYQKKFIDAAAGFVQKHKPTHIAIPAVAGIDKPAPFLKLVGQKLDVTCFELASTQPSVPGMRLHNALNHALHDAGVTRIAARVESFTASSGQVRSVTLRMPDGDSVEMNATAFVLASGKFTAGGLRRDEALEETVFDLPVFSEGRPARDMFMYDLVKPKINEKQPIFSCGVKVDAAMNAVDAQGAAVYENVFCAGSVLGGYDSMRDRCGSGVAVATGCVAGENAAIRSGH